MILIENATICAGAFALKGVQLAVPTGEYGVLMGETGAGKTTLVEGICGLRSVVEGRIVLGDRDVTQLPPAERNIGYVPQDAALFPRMNVREHLTFPLRIRRWRRREIGQRADELAETLNIAHLQDRNIHGLSGGERQRVAIGRALSWRPHTLLLDEPLSAVDEQAREALYGTLKHLQRESGVTVLHVTHNSHSAERLADRRFELRQGEIFATSDHKVRSAAQCM